MTDAERIIALEAYVREIHDKVSDARKLRDNPNDVDAALADLLNDIQCTSDGTWGGMRFLTGVIR